MNNTAFIVAGWSAVFGGVAAYTAVLIRRGRSLSAQVPPERRRWSTTPTTSDAPRSR